MYTGTWLIAVVCLLLTLPVAGTTTEAPPDFCTKSSFSYVPDLVANESLSITRPLSGLYLFDLRVLPFAGQVVMGTVTVETAASAGVARVEFLLKPKCGCRLDVMINDTQPPYSWTWSGDSERVFDEGLVILSVWGYDSYNQKVAEDTIMLLRLPL
jgi:hypothetical protein